MKPLLKNWILAALTFSTVLLVTCIDVNSQPVFGPVLKRTTAVPHDCSAFTQGFLFYRGFFYESTGLHGSSTVRKVDPFTGQVLESHRLPDKYFGEGIAVLDHRLYQVTWREGEGFIYAPGTLETLGRFRFDGEGWGLTTDGSHLILSDGTCRLKFMDPLTFEIKKELEVSDGGRLIYSLNELEWIHGEIWANIWQQDNIARIDPSNGDVLGWVNVAGFVSRRDRVQGAGVANGIAFDPVENRLWVTGKNWPRVFEVAFPVTLGVRNSDRE
jgi:glutaminyl-peptide cyclotransferase